MPSALHDRLLFLEARLAMVEDRLDYLRSQVRLVVRSLVGWAEFGIFYLTIRLIVHFYPEKKGGS